MKKISLLIAACVLLQLSFAFARDTIIISGHPEYPPVMWHEGSTIAGVASEMAKTVFEELGVPYEIKFTGPWKRVQLNARNGDIDVIAASYINPERQRYMDYTVPFMKDPVVLFVLKGKKFPFRRWEDLIGKVGNTVHGESYGEIFDRFMEKNLDVERTSTVVQNFLKLEYGRVDYAIIGLYPGLAYASATGFENKVEALPHPVVEENFCMAFSKKSRFSHLIPRVNEIIGRLKKEGAIEKWIEKYLDYYKAVQSRR